MKVEELSIKTGGGKNLKAAYKCFTSKNEKQGLQLCTKSGLKWMQNFCTRLNTRLSKLNFIWKLTFCLTAFFFFYSSLVAFESSSS